MTNKKLLAPALALLVAIAFSTGVLAQGATNPGGAGLRGPDRSLPSPQGATTGTYGIFVPGPNPAPGITGTTIDFEGRAEGELIDNQYSALGVTFTQDDEGRPQIDNSPFLFAYESDSGVGVLTGSTEGGAPFPSVAGLVAEFSEPVSKVGAFMSDTGPLGDYTVTIYDAGGTLLDTITVLPADFPDINDAECDPSFPWEGSGCGVWVGFDVGTPTISRIQFGPSAAFGDAFAIDDLVFARPEPSGQVYRLQTAPQSGQLYQLVDSGGSPVASSLLTAGSVILQPESVHYFPNAEFEGPDQFIFRCELAIDPQIFDDAIVDIIVSSPGTGDDLTIDFDETGTGMGDVAIDVGGSVIAVCSTDCTVSIAAGNVVKLQARPVALGIDMFTGWTGPPCSGSSQIFTFTKASGPETCGARFDQ